MIATLALIKNDQEKSLAHGTWLPLVMVLLTGAALVYGTWDIPAFGDANAPAQQHVAPYYLQQSMAQTGIPNVVTSVLASYRGFDTLGETVVVFTACIAVLLLIGGKRDKQNTGSKGRKDNET